MRATTLVTAIDRRFTPAGRVVLVATAFAAGFGIDTTLSVAYQFFGLGAGLLAVALIGARRAVAPASVERCSSGIAAVGVPFSYEIIVRNPGKRPLEGYALRDELHLGAHTVRAAAPRRSLAQAWSPRALLRYRGAERRWRRGGSIREVSIPPIPPRSEIRITMGFTPERRGAVRFANVALFQSDPLGLARRMSALPLPGRLVVLPRRYPVPPLALSGAQRLQQGGVASAGKVGHAEEFLGLRDYRAGDSLKMIQWKSWARLGRPIVREHENEYFVRHALIVDTAVEPRRAAAVEAAASVAASLAASLDSSESLLDLIMIDERVFRFTAGHGLGELHALLEMIAVMRASGAATFAALAANVLDEAALASSLVLVLTDWDSARNELLAMLAARGVAMRVLLIQEPGEPPPRDAAVRIDIIRTDAVAAGLAAL